MNPETGWVERFNSTVRGVITLMFGATFCWMAIQEKVDAGIFANVLSSVVAFWFAAKAAEKMIQQALPAPPPPGTTTEVKTTTPALPGTPGRGDQDPIAPGLGRQ